MRGVSKCVLFEMRAVSKCVAFEMKETCGAVPEISESSPHTRQNFLHFAPWGDQPNPGEVPVG